MADIKELITRNHDEISSYGIIPYGTVKTGKRGRPAVCWYLNEEQALLVCILSKTENAALVRKQVIDTFMAHRRGQLVQPPAISTGILEEQAAELKVQNASAVGNAAYEHPLHKNPYTR